MKFLKLLPIFLCLSMSSYGADLKLSALPKLTNALTGDLFLVSAFSGGTTNSKAITLNHLNQSLLSLGQQGPYILETNGTARGITLIGPVNMTTIVRVTNSVTGEWWDWSASGTNAYARLKDLTNALAALTFVTNGQSGVTLTGTFSGSGAGLTNLTFGNISVGTNKNTIYGLEAGTNITTGDYNTFIGYQAGRTNNVGSQNTYLGALAGGLDDKQNAGTNNIYVGYRAGSFFWTGVGQSNLLGHFIAGASQFPVTNVYFGNGLGNDNSPDNYVINGSGSIGTDSTGGELGLAGGRGTGSGTPGSVMIKTPIASAAVNTNQQALSNRVSIAGGTGLMTVYNDFQLNGVASGGNFLLTNATQSVTGRKSFQDTGSKLINLGTVSGTQTVPWNTNWYVLTASGHTKFDLSGSPPPTGESFTKYLMFFQDGAGSWGLTNGTTALLVNPTASSITVLGFTTIDGGTTVYVSSSYSTPASGVSLTGSTNSLVLDIGHAYFTTNSPAAFDQGSNYVKRILFDDATVEACRFDYSALPVDYSTNAFLVIGYSPLAGAATKTNVFGFQTQVIPPGGAIDADSWSTMINVTNVIPTSSTITNFTVNLGISANPYDFFRLRITREGTNTMDSAVGDMAIRSVALGYTRR